MNEEGDPVLMFRVVEFHNDNRVEDRVWHMEWDLVKQEVRYKAYVGQGFWVNCTTIVPYWSSPRS